ncbi:MAG: choice-of-anchor D domain-containing protein [Proteobacteria bacterium]|nr:choice-of-anchor D domain-containing protein [Pseudomonadota bacterium]
MRRPLLLPLLIAATACSDGGECDPLALDDDDSNYSDPFQGYQDISLSPAVIDLDDVPFGGSETVQVTLSNDGDQDLVIESFGMDDWSDANWNVVPSTVPDLLEPGDSAEIDLVFVNDQAQPSIAAFDVYSDDPDEERASVGLIGRPDDNRPDARLTPVVLDFGFVFSGEELSVPLTLSNLGTSTLEITAAELVQTGEAFVLEPSTLNLAGTSVESGEDATINVTFTPTNVQLASAPLTLWTSDPQRPTISAQLRGNGDGAEGCTPPTVTLTSSTAPFAIEVGTGASLVIEGTVTDTEQPASLLLIELYRDGALIEDVPAPGGNFSFDIDIDDYEVEDVFEEFPRGLATFEVRVSDACQLSASVNLVGIVDESAALDPTDNDGDGWGTGDGDCNDDDDSVFPGRLEDADTVDNDCDGTADEGTTASDDDGDTFSEDDGDCDDGDDSRHPDAEEGPNHLDDDCDGDVDEGTSFSDDDGDGLSDIAGDCNDEDPLVFAGAIEWCDGLDNNCGAGADEDCAEEVRAPQIIGDVVTDKYKIPLATRVDASVRVLSDDPALTYAWVTDKGSFLGETDGPTVEWQAPSNTPDNEALIDTFANLQVTVTDSRGRIVNGFGVLLFDEGAGPVTSAVGGQVCGCALADAGRPGVLALAVLLISIRRRKIR